MMARAIPPSPQLAHPWWSMSAPIWSWSSNPMGSWTSSFSNVGVQGGIAMGRKRILLPPHHKMWEAIIDLASAVDERMLDEIVDLWLRHQPNDGEADGE